MSLKFSYSKLNTYSSCAFKYYLQYDQGHYLYTESLASELGTLIHYIEEHIAISIINGTPIDYKQLKKDLLDINIPKKSAFDTDGGIFGINILKEKYKTEFYQPNNEGKSYATKVEDYLNKGIYRLENWLKDHPGWKIYGVESFFQTTYQGYLLSGYIDRVLYNPTTNEYIIEDLKTKDHPFSESDLQVPLQFVIYVQAFSQMKGIKPAQIKCQYNLPFCDLVQPILSKNFLTKGLKQMDNLFDKINKKDWTAHPTPLCYWCNFSETNPAAPEEGKHLCPYHSLWTRGGNHKGYEVAHPWTGIENYNTLLGKIKIEKQNSTDPFLDF